jgi:Holliday junction resolvase-like predicted endonuclease
METLKLDIERNVVMSVLKLTRPGPIASEIVSRDARIAKEIVDNILKKLQKNGLVYLRDSFLEVDSVQRLKMAVHAIRLGADFECASGFLDWKEFENFAALAFEINGYRVNKNFRFKHRGRRWEIDIVGCKKPLVVCVDCKHWHHGMYPSAFGKIVEAQVNRTYGLSESLFRLVGKIRCADWKKATLVPTVLSLVRGRFKFYDDVPIVPVLQLQNFLSKLPAQADTLKHFSNRISAN